MAILNSFVNDIFECIATEASKLVAYSKKVHNLLMQNSDISVADHAKRVGQAHNLRRYQVSDKVLFCRGK
ncbi:hypothetical protein L208DRAFT_1512575, partial [Tricholoma matsutake]